MDKLRNKCVSSVSRILSWEKSPPNPAWGCYPSIYSPNPPCPHPHPILHAKEDLEISILTAILQ